jgi:hypothetical protein
MDYLLSYWPLANSPRGRAIATANGIPPYVDASCRREPDFQCSKPFVSGLCRPSFVAKLAAGARLVYVTKMSGVHRGGRRLVAVLEAVQEFSSHVDAAGWYQSNGIRVPANCIVPGNGPVPFGLTDPKMTREAAKYTDSKVWDRAVYVPRAKKCLKCFACEASFMDLHNPPIVASSFWDQWFGGDPGQRLQNMGLPLGQPVYLALLWHAGIV